jgi:hypothetical protein
VTLQPEDLGVDDLKEELADLRERALDPGAMDDTTSDKLEFATTKPRHRGSAVNAVQRPPGMSLFL